MTNLPASENLPVIAVDGGGTRCRLALRAHGKDVTIEVGAANVTTDFEAALEQIRGGLTKLASRAGVTTGDLAKMPAFVGLAGVTDQGMADKVADALPFRRVRVTDDRPPALRGALGPRDGVVAHCGTGSFVAMQRHGNATFAGGWGPVLGDPASAQWVGRRALSVTLDAVDGLVPHSELSRQLLDVHAGAAGIVAFAAQARPIDFGALAPIVTQLAQQDDALAQSVMQDAGDAITDTLTKMGWRPDMTICLTGGIAPHHAPYLAAPMQAAITQPIAAPLFGALALAQDFSEECPDERG